MVQDNSFRIHHRNLQKLAAEILKVQINFAPEVIKGIFRIVENAYSFRNETKFKSYNVQMARF